MAEECLELADADRSEREKWTFVARQYCEPYGHPAHGTAPTLLERTSYGVGRVRCREDAVQDEVHLFDSERG
jgi:hypothetical protein